MSGGPIVMSLRPGPYARLLEGAKRHEFRRRLSGEMPGAFLYLAAPVSAIAAYAAFGRPLAGTPEELAALAEADEPGTFEETFRYFDGLERGFALPVSAVREIEPLPLAELRERFGYTPPRSYRRQDAASALARELAARLEAAGGEPAPALENEAGE
ncbi:hypothetical protein [Saccharibacillus alkalitolerans]|uniref:ASCH domain-containing protein n=1 Tax=Saccharibacillus alkalitolerans TaxID=2705290 RepID=A0ABX0FCG4_9BACL|nr:hypothetical protein [Saccharibacillus alkalitolerans]NGZ76991.1 hypothetical protein [Saccharibacillus alkalitolerans]